MTPRGHLAPGDGDGKRNVLCLSCACLVLCGDQEDKINCAKCEKKEKHRYQSFFRDEDTYYEHMLFPDHIN